MSLDDVSPDVHDAAQLEALFGADLRAARDAQALPMLGDELAAVFADGLPPVPAPPAGAADPATGTRHRRRTLRRALAGAGVLVLGTGSLGVAGALPAPVQGAVADVADVVGIDLPKPSDDEAPDVPVVVEDEAPAATTTVPAPSTTTTAAPSTTTVPAGPPSTMPSVLDEDPHDRGRGQERREEVRPRDRGREDPKGRPEHAGKPEEPGQAAQRGQDQGRGRGPVVSLPDVARQEKGRKA